MIAGDRSSPATAKGEPIVAHCPLKRQEAQDAA
jgi:hypothetical protein